MYVLLIYDKFLYWHTAMHLFRFALTGYTACYRVHYVIFITVHITVLLYSSNVVIISRQISLREPPPQPRHFNLHSTNLLLITESHSGETYAPHLSTPMSASIILLQPWTSTCSNNLYSASPLECPTTMSVRRLIFPYIFPPAQFVTTAL